MLNLDPWTVLWTGINLVVLYLLMRHFLFKPVTAMMEQRTKAIEDGLSQAEAAKQAAQALDQENEARLAQVRGQADQIVAQAKLQGQREYDQIISSAQADAQAMYGVDAGRSVLNAFRALGFYTLGAFPLWLGGMSLSLACFFLIASSTVAAFSYIGILMVLPMALDNLGKYVNPMFTSLYHLTLNYHIDQLLVGDLPWSKIGQCWLIGLGWTLVSTALGAALFARKEIK